MNCEFCDNQVNTEHEHYKEVRDDNGNVIWECTGWTCEPMNWRKRAIEAEARVKMLEDKHRTHTENDERILRDNQEETCKLCSLAAVRDGYCRRHQ